MNPSRTTRGRASRRGVLLGLLSMGALGGALFLFVVDDRGAPRASEIALGGAEASGDREASDARGLPEALRPAERLALEEQDVLREPAGEAQVIEPESGVRVRRPPTPEELADFYAFADEAVAEVRSQKTEDALRVIEGRRSKIEDHLREFSMILGLAEHQSDALRDVLQRELDREAEYVLLEQSGASEKEISALRESDREARRAELAGFLNEKQVNGLDLHLGGPRN